MTLPDHNYAQRFLETACIVALLLLVWTLLGGCAARPVRHTCEVRMLSERDRAILEELVGEASLEDERMVGR